MAAVRAHYRSIDIEATENTTYRLHSATMGFVYSEQYPRQVLCVEISRELLADPCTPFRQMNVGPAKVERMCGPLAALLGRPAAES